MSRKKLSPALRQKIRHHIMGDLPREIVAILIIMTAFIVIGYTFIHYQISTLPEKTDGPQPPQSVLTFPYTGKIYHIFFHSLVVYPELAFGVNDGRLYRDYMITRDEFVKILPLLYANHFVLIDPHSIYTTKSDGTIVQRQLLLPRGKKPLIISLDDLNYYEHQKHHGLANKLVLDTQGRVATEIITPQGVATTTRDGDVIPLLDDFLVEHPDFSLDGTKGVIAVTGHDGILGYRTNNVSSPTYIKDVADVRAVIAQLKATGWQFASHSYSHEHPFQTNTISYSEVVHDTDRWNAEVRPLVGSTDMFVGPFGQIFSYGDPRRDYIVSQGFTMLFGVGMDLYLGYTPKYVIQDRADIDGIRLHETPWMLKDYFDVSKVVGTNTR